jgi:hypothetical protein
MYHGGKHIPTNDSPPDLGINVAEEIVADESIG